VAGGHSGVEEIFEAEGEAIAVAVGEISAEAIVAVVVATLDAAIEAAVVVGAILAAEGEEISDAIVSEGAVEMISDEGVAAVILVEAEVVAISDEEGATFVAEATSDVGVETFEEEAALGMIIGTAKALLQTKAGEISTHSRARHNRTNGISHLPRTPAEINFLKDAFHRNNKINLGTNKVDSHQTNSTIRECLRSSSNNRVVEITHPRRRRNPTGREAVFQILRRSKRTHINSNNSLGLTSNNNSNNRASMRMRASKISKHLAGIINRTKIAWRAIAASRTSRCNSSNPHQRLLRKPLQCNQW